ncbi:MAG: polyprenyl synthetase family protein [Candidatus Heimdallarchaeota archaeon]|nr:polyprenyl synthetase family protein [Candidatus Heimdallarchaeota archaeon]MCK5047767.1 polyprenyl synthetase family protein [Candidatus Heimdallarchaeota archaeon]
MLANEKAVEMVTGFPEVDKINETLVQIIDFHYSDNPMKKWLSPYLFPEKPGKRLRPLISLYSYELSSGIKAENKLVYELICASELIHNAALIIDDVYDKDFRRRGNDAFHVSHGTFSAMATAHNLSALSEKIISQARDFDMIDAYIEMQTALSNTLILSRRLEQPPLINEAFFYKLLDYKTASIFRCSARIGSIHGVTSNKSIEEEDAKETVKKMSDIGTDFGIAYQLRDDVLAIIGSSKVLGKSPDSDITNRIQTLIVLESIRLGSDSDKETLLDYYINKNETITHDELRAILINSGGVNSVIKKCEFHRERAISSLEDFPDSTAKIRYTNLLRKISFEGLKY